MIGGLYDDCITEDRMGVRIVRLTGDLTISRADEMRSALLESLKGAEHIEIDLSSVEDADLSCLQLLCSAHRTSKHLGKFSGSATMSRVRSNKR